MHSAVRIVPSVLALTLLLVGCGTSESRSAGDTSAAENRCGPEVRRVAEELGSRMRLVSVLGPDSVVRRELGNAYGSIATADLLQTWLAAPKTAPGRQVSNPWPARIEPQHVQTEGDGCLVHGQVVYVTTADTTTAAERRPVSIRLRRDSSGWRVSGYQEAPPNSGAAPDSMSPVAVVRQYYRAIAAGQYDSAYALWGQGGEASGQTPRRFAAGFAQTANVRVTIRDSVRLEGAAGSQYATVPVAIESELRDGRHQHFVGTYTLRRSMVDGATPEQRRWHIYKADVQLMRQG